MQESCKNLIKILFCQKDPRGSTFGSYAFKLTINTRAQELLILVNQAKQLHDELETATEGVKLAKDVVRREVEGGVVVGGQVFLGLAVRPSVLGVEVEARPELLDDFSARLRPDRFQVVARDVPPTGFDHLVRDLMSESF
jgi:hypothetical protein